MCLCGILFVMEDKAAATEEFSSVHDIVNHVLL